MARDGSKTVNAKTVKFTDGPLGQCRIIERSRARVHAGIGRFASKALVEPPDVAPRPPSFMAPVRSGLVL
jgi:hypothetical protein